MTSTFHAGEQAVQEQAGVRRMADRLAPSIRRALPPVARDFLSRQPMAVAGFSDDTGYVWASPLAGNLGFLHAESDEGVRIDAVPLGSDPLASVWRDGLALGLLAIEPETRRRMRINGILANASSQGADLIIEQAYANCSKYIQARHWEAERIDASEESNVASFDRLTASHQEWILGADTFFIASRHPEFGADASHRGGNPGFVHVIDAATIAFPDYAGNNMFNTLGNLAVDPHAGLLFMDYAAGHILQLTGEAEILWDPMLAIEYPGAERVVSFRIKGVRETRHALPLHWQFLEYSPANPD